MLRWVLFRKIFQLLQRKKFSGNVIFVAVNGKQHLSIEKEMGVHIVQILKHFQVLMIFRLFFQILRQNGICKKIILYGHKMLQKVQEKKYGGFVQKVTLMICL